MCIAIDVPLLTDHKSSHLRKGKSIKNHKTVRRADGKFDQRSPGIFIALLRIIY